MLYNGEENLSFVLSKPLIARESDLRHAFHAAADPGVGDQGWTLAHLGCTLAPPQGRVAPPQTFPVSPRLPHPVCVGFEPNKKGNREGKPVQGLDAAIQSWRLRLFFLPLSHQVGAD